MEAYFCQVNNHPLWLSAAVGTQDRARSHFVILQR